MVPYSVVLSAVASCSTSDPRIGTTVTCKEKRVKMIQEHVRSRNPNARYLADSRKEHPQILKENKRQLR